MIHVDTETQRETTVFERFVGLMRIGSYFEHAAMASGISKDTAYEWIKVAAKAKLAAHGQPDLTQLPAHTVRCIAFSDAVDRATGEWVAGELTRAQAIARGGVERTIITEKVDRNNNVIERLTRTETMLPSESMIRWRLARRLPKFYGEKVEIVESDAGALTDDDSAQVLADEMEAYLQGVKDTEAQAKKAKPRARRPPRPMPAQVPE